MICHHVWIAAASHNLSMEFLVTGVLHERLLTPEGPERRAGDSSDPHHKLSSQPGAEITSDSEETSEESPSFVSNNNFSSCVSNGEDSRQTR